MRSLTFTLTGKTKAARLLLIGLLLVMVSTTVTAQKTVSGVIKNNTDGSPLSKASVQVKGTSRGKEKAISYKQSWVYVTQSLTYCNHR